jgi:hypothetical protein
MGKTFNNKAIRIAIVIFILIISYLGYMGIFDRLKVEEKEMGPYIFAYEEYIGDYAKTGPIFDKVYKELLDAGIETKLGLGIYYDNPRIVDKDKLQSKAGSIITPEQEKKIDELGLNIKVMNIEKTNVYTLDFPYKNSASIIFGVIKAYPTLEKYMLKNSINPSPSYEIYDMEGGKITYFMPLNK